MILNNTIMIMSGAISLLGLLILNSQMNYDVYILPSFMNGAFVYPTNTVRVNNHMYLNFESVNDTVCNGAIGCIDEVCKLSNHYEFICLYPNTCYSSKMDTLMLFHLFRSSRILMYIAITLLGAWSIVFIVKGICNLKHVLFKPLTQKIILYIFYMLYVISKLSIIIAYILYFIFHNDYSILTGDYLDSHLIDALIITAVWYVIVLLYDLGMGCYASYPVFKINDYSMLGY